MSGLSLDSSYNVGEALSKHFAMFIKEMVAEAQEEAGKYFMERLREKCARFADSIVGDSSIDYAADSTTIRLRLPRQCMMTKEIFK